MSSAKRAVIELSSGSDDDNPLVTRRRKMRRRSAMPPPQREEETLEDQATFAEFLARAFPTKLVAADVAEYIQRESNIRLEKARQEGVVLDSVFIGRDCLPTWIGMHWDPKKESLHCAIQDRLLDLEVSNVLGDIIRKELMDKGNRKLEEARQLGVDIENITIGKGLLATWDTPGIDLQVPLEEQLSYEEEPSYDDMGQSSLETAVSHSSIFSRRATPESAALSQSTATAVPRSPGVVSDRSSNAYYTCSEFSSGDSTEDEEEAFDDVIYMNNAVDPHAHYADGDDKTPHILPDVEIAGGPEGYSDVDIEVYLAEDDEDVEHLPEIELAIDGDAFAHYFGDDEAVDVEIAGMDLRCALDVPQDQGDEGADSVTGEDICGPNEEEDEQSDARDEEDAQDGDDAIAQHGGFETTLAAPMLRVEDEEPNTGIEITEDGFAW
ncbi:hypothetical protein Trco_008034 [Trichoderma cornu-damae]|uniref:Uncharacterized protein n=1 Tax=Trichoderma cornu-damae TaxID=654480 RepID=A0A9P8TSH5_9HYPO|nr:hypothetical protein Trco_008034 [Trichoderma cornu-damae]